MVFLTQFDARDRIISNAGSRIKQLYEARVDNQGHIDLVESGTEDLYDYIQSFKESVDINTIVKRFAAGDTDVLARRQATYGDFTQLPGTYAELLNTVIQGENYFNSLPLETRAKFNHSSVSGWLLWITCKNLWKKWVFLVKRLRGQRLIPIPLLLPRRPRPTVKLNESR